MKLKQPFALWDATNHKDPALSFKFWVKIDGMVTAQFSECSGLRMEREVKTYKEGGFNHFVHVLPGPVKYANIVLKYGVSNTADLIKWCYKGIEDGKVIRKDFSILLRNAEGQIWRCWNVKDAFPVKWEGPQLKTDSNQVTIETIELAHHGIELDSEIS